MKNRIKAVIRRISTKGALKESPEAMGLTPCSESEPADIFIAGWPKSGNTWMQSLVAGMLYGIDPRFLPDRLAHELVPDLSYQSFYKRYQSLVFFKTHELPDPRHRRVIHLVRDGRDAIVSYFHVLRSVGKPRSMRELILGEDCYPCSWQEHARAWRDNPYQAELITVRYEDLLGNPVPELKKICAFAGMDRENGILQTVIAGTTISEMQRKEKEYGLLNSNWAAEKGARFFRSGEAGVYRNEMSREDQAEFLRVAGSELELFGYSKARPGEKVE